MLWGGLEESEEILFGLVGGRKGSLKKKKKSKGGMRIVGEKRKEKKTPTHQKNLSGQQQIVRKRTRESSMSSHAGGPKVWKDLDQKCGKPKVTEASIRSMNRLQERE